MKYVFSAKLNELNLIKLEIPSESEIRDIIAGDRSIYDKRIQERLCCKICLRYDLPSFGGILVAKLFQCLHFFHSQCVTYWKKWGLPDGNHSGPINACFCCKSKLCNQYKNFFHYE